MVNKKTFGALALVAVAVVLAVVALFFLGGAPFFSFVTGYHATEPDRYYDYYTTLAPIEQGQPLVVTVSIAEKDGRPISSCNPTWTLSSPSPGYSQGMCTVNRAGEPWCHSQTLFNARSIRAFVDGQEIQDSYLYPRGVGLDISTQLGSVGAVCCWGVDTPCSACGDQDRASMQYQRAFVFSSGDLASGQTMNERALFSIRLVQPSLAPGNHTLKLYYYAETLFIGAPRCSASGNYYEQSKIKGWGLGDNNLMYNVEKTIVFEVANDTAFFENTTRIMQLQGEKAALEAQVALLGSILAQTQTELTTVQGDLAIAKAAIASADASMGSAQATIISLNSQIISLNAIIVSTQAQLDQAAVQLRTAGAAYEEASAKLEASKNAQNATQTQLASALSDLKTARDANVDYRATLDYYSIKLQETQLLTLEQSNEITLLRNLVLTKEQIANQSIAFAEQKEAQAQAALAEVYRVMQDKALADAAFKVELDATLAQLNNVSLSLSAKIAALNTYKAQLDTSYSDLQAAQAQLAQANAAISERQAALSQAQSDIAALQLANSDLRARLAGEQVKSAQLQEQLTSLQAQKVQLSATLAALNSDFAMLQNATLEDRTTWELQKSGLQSEISRIDGQIIYLQAQLAGASVLPTGDDMDAVWLVVIGAFAVFFVAGLGYFAYTRIRGR